MLAWLKRSLLGATFLGLVLVAAASVRPACTIVWYQPEVPKALRK